MSETKRVYERKCKTCLYFNPRVCLAKENEIEKTDENGTVRLYMPRTPELKTCQWHKFVRRNSVKPPEDKTAIPENKDSEKQVHSTCGLCRQIFRHRAMQFKRFMPMCPSCRTKVQDAVIDGTADALFPKKNKKYAKSIHYETAETRKAITTDDGEGIVARNAMYDKAQSWLKCSKCGAEYSVLSRFAIGLPLCDECKKEIKAEPEKEKPAETHGIRAMDLLAVFHSAKVSSSMEALIKLCAEYRIEIVLRPAAKP
jgi:predicted amidophosphoribosyltransferase